MRIGLAADHEGYAMKEQIESELRNRDIKCTDYGAFFLDPDDDFPDFVIPLARAVSRREIHRGIAICGSGIGACIAANKIGGVRASVIQDSFSARQGVADDDMNVICLGANLISSDQAFELVQVFLDTQFIDQPRFVRRLRKISTVEEKENLL